MRKYVIIYFLLVFSFISLNLYAGTGSAADHIIFTIVLIGLLAGIMGLIAFFEFVVKKIKVFLEKLIDQDHVNNSIRFDVEVY